MGVFLGVDVGAVSLKAAVVCSGRDAQRAPGAAANAIFRRLTPPDAASLTIWVVAPRRIRGRPLDAVRASLGELLEALGVEVLGGLMLTGSGSRLPAEILQVATCNEFQAAVRALDFFHPNVRTVFEIGANAVATSGSSPIQPAEGLELSTTVPTGTARRERAPSWISRLRG